MQKHWQPWGRASFGLIIGTMAMALAGCENLPAPTSSAASTSAQAADSEQDVARTDLFQVREMALWDGRPTFGGVWIAYSGDIQPERVRIENLSNGKTVIGALFRREREMPGPNIQISADAAAALSVVAGTPVELRVTALRRETVEAPAAPAPTPAPAPATAPVVAPDTTTPAVAPPPQRDQNTSDAIETHALELPDTPAPAVVAPAAGAPSRPYAQVGTFATESNASDLVTILGTNGVQAAVRQVTVDGRTLYRVVAGPADSAEALAALIAKLKTLGYADAFPIR